jgi:Phage capsid protein
MSTSAFQAMYRSEFVAGYEQHQSLLRQACTNEAQIKGQTAIFLVADSGGASAQTRGLNGLIPARADNLTQATATLVEWHDLSRATGFNIFASQGDRRRIMQMTTMAVINRKIDSDIIGELDANTAARAGASAVTASLSLVSRAIAILGINKVPFDGQLTGVITPAFYSYLLQVKEFDHADYTNNKQFDNADGAYSDRLMTFRWLGVNWMVHPGLTGLGTSSEKCYIFHRSAIGHAMDTAGLDTPVGYHEEQQYSWARASGFFGTKTLQTNGIVQMLHDGSALVAA